MIIALVWNSFSNTSSFSISLHPISAQISSISPSPSSGTIGVKITSPTRGQEVPINGALSLSGSSTDTLSTNCQASVIVNNIRPYKPVNPAEINDYSKWNFLLNSSYTSIKEGPNNKITAKLECPPNLTKWYSVNVTGVPPARESINHTFSSPSPSHLISNSTSNVEVPTSVIRTGVTDKTLLNANASVINITSPISGHQISSGSKVTIFGTSMDDFYSNCKVYTKRNDLPYQNVTAAGLTGSADYSVWKFTYTDKYGLITPGNTNNITAKISCNENNKNLSSAFIDTNSITNNVDGTATSYASIELVGVNQPPEVAIHVDDSQEVKEGDEIVLDGRDSSDPNGDSLTYSWKQTSGFLDGSDVKDPTESVAHFKVPDDLTRDTTFEFELAATDNYGAIGTKTISIDVASNSAPIADAGGNIQAIRGEQVTLDGSESHDPDPTGEIISYLWKSSGDNGDGDGDDGDGRGPSLQDANQPVSTFSVPFAQDDTAFEFRLAVIDDEGAEDEDTVMVEVRGNSKPVADSGNNKKAEIGEQVTLDGKGSNDPDPTGKIVSYNWEQTTGSPTVDLDDASSATPSFIVPIIDEDTTFGFTLTVTDNEGAADENKVEVEVETRSPTPSPPPSDPDEADEAEEDQSDELYAFPSDEKEEHDWAEEEEEEEEEEDEKEETGTDSRSAILQIPEIRDFFS
jgi:PKD domain